MLFFSKRLRAITFLAVWLLTIVVWTPMAMLSHVASSQAAIHHSVSAETTIGSQQVASVQAECHVVDCGDLIHHMSNCDLACEPLASPVSYEIIVIRSTNSFLLVEPKSLSTISPVAIERPPKYSV